ncbi:MAG: hypothetical protein AAF958_13110, partial [Planctomycetota bacterium]
NLVLEVAKKEYDLDVVLGAAGTAYEAAKAIAEADVPVLLGSPLVISTSDGPVNVFGEFRTAGCRVLLRTSVGAEAASLPTVMAHAVTRGVGSGEILRALTSDMVDVMHLENMGELVPGNDADLTLFDGPPFYPGSEVVGVMIQGDWVYLDRRYRKLASASEDKE